MTGSTPLELVAAVAANGVIGRAGQLPWHLPDDLKFFKSLTTGHTVLMGRRTFESIGRPLPNRRSIVVSRQLTQPPHAGVELARSLEDALRLLDNPTEPAFVVGGAVLYAAAIPLVRAMHLTELEEPVEGDTIFPPFDRSAWQVVRSIPHPRDSRHAHAFHIRTYVCAGSDYSK